MNPEPAGGPRRLKVLLVEDNARDAVLVREILAEIGEPRIEVEWVSRLASALNRLARERVDLVLLDLALPDSNWYETFRQMQNGAAGAPIVVLSGIRNRAHALDLIQAGAHDYLVKGEVDSDVLARTVHYAMIRHQAQEEERRRTLLSADDAEAAEKALRFSQKLSLRLELQELLKIAVESLPGLLHAELVSLFLLSPRDQRLELAAHNHRDWAHDPDGDPEPEADIMRDAMRARDLVRIHNFSCSAYAKPARRGKYRLDSAVCAPLLAGDRILGVLNLACLEPRWMSAPHAREIRRVADHLSLALHSAMLQERIESLLAAASP